MAVGIELHHGNGAKLAVIVKIGGGMRGIVLQLEFLLGKQIDAAFGVNERLPIRLVKHLRIHEARHVFQQRIALIEKFGCIVPKSMRLGDGGIYHAEFFSVWLKSVTADPMSWSA